MGHEYCDYLIDTLAPWAPVTAKRMFGGWGLYRAGTIFCIVIEDTPYFKVDDSNRADYEEAGAEPFTYMTKDGNKTVMSYWQVPGHVLDDSEEIQGWAEKAYRASLASKAAKKKPTGSTKRKSSGRASAKS